MTFLTRTSLKNRLIVGLTTIAVAVLGILSMGSIKQELMPTMDTPMAWVVVQSSGLAPEEMVQAVTEPAEQALSAVPGVTTVYSSTSSGSTDITVEWRFGEDDDAIIQAIRTATEALKPGFPQGADVQVYTGGNDSVPAMMFTAAPSGDAAGFDEALAQRVVPALQAVSGVSRVTLSGGEEQRVAIDLRPADVDRLRVDPSQIEPALQMRGAALPAGETDSEDGKISITVGTPLASVEEIAEIPVTTETGSVVRVSDFADVSVNTVATGSISRVNGKPALSMEVYPATGANVVDISHAITAELDRQAEALHAEFVTLFDQAPYIEQSIHDLSVEGGLGLFFAVIVILAFLGSWRSTAIAAVSIPLSLLITLIGLWWSNNTLNILTLGALTIAIGRVVDDSIVVIENITRRRGSGALTVEGVVASVRQVAGAITASTLTTVAVFLPIAFVSGVAGQLFRPFAITVTIALLASLVVALTIVPVLAFWFLRTQAKKKSGVATQGPDAVGGAEAEVHPHDDLDEIHTDPDRLQRALMPVLNATRRRPVLTVLSSVLILVLTLAMTAFLRTDLLGSSGAETLQITQTPPDGEPDADLVVFAEPVEKALAEIDGVRDVMTSIPVVAAGTDATISYSVQLADGADAQSVQSKIERRLDRVADVGEFELASTDSFSVGSGGIELQIRGTDPSSLQEASELLEQRLAAASGVQTVKSSLAGEQPVLRITLDDAKAAKLGFDRQTVATAIQEALEGKTVGRLMLEGSEREIVLHAAGAGRDAAKLGEIVLPVTAQQTAAAQKRAADDLETKAKTEAEEQRLAANAELTQQLNEGAAQRSELVNQLAELTRQLAALEQAPVDPDPVLTPEESAQQSAAERRAEQIAGLQSAIAGVQAGIEGIDQQVSATRDQQTEAANQLAEQQASEEEQKAAGEVRGTPITVSDIAEVEEELTAPTIARTDGERQVTLTVTPAKGQLDLASMAVDEAIAQTQLPAGVSFELGGVSAEQDDAFSQLGLAMLGAVMLVLLVMVATFRSFRGPLVLLISIPFAATGAILGLLITDTALGLPALIGLLMLIGIVVTNAIVLMDLVNRLRGSGATLEEAVEHGTRLRLRPILMTAAATIFALVPMSLGLTGGGVFISKPLAIVVIGGLISSTLLTLVLVPILYTWVERRHTKKSVRRVRRIARRRIRAAAMDEVQSAS